MRDPKLEQYHRILDAAFFEWTKTNFTRMSLSPVAAKLAVTKPALYRHFKSKDDLLKAMSARFLDETAGALRDFVARAPRGDLRPAIDEYFRFIFGFFRGHASYCSFLICHLLKKAENANGGMIMRYPEITEYFREVLSPVEGRQDPARVDRVVRFIHLTAIFWILQLFAKTDQKNAETPGLDFTKNITEEAATSAAERAASFCLGGYCSEKAAGQMDFAAVEKKAWIRKDEMMEPDRIFSAIESVISEMGYAEASVERIAERIGINKSSMYFYFKNKDEMLARTIRREQDHFFALLRGRLACFSGTLERLYTFFVALVSNMANNPSLSTVLHWMRYRNIGPVFHGKEARASMEKLEFLRESIVGNFFDEKTDRKGVMVLLIVFLLMNEMRFFRAEASEPEKYMYLLRSVFVLFCSGVAGEAALIGEPVTKE